ncbi:MAG TPA: sialidase family protein, partial [Planctomycetaceae bacterium]|nr:sialidase family protein [Planctomycetaceae bacterium]
TQIFDPGTGEHGHVHASCIIECPNGDLRAVWYENGQSLPPPYFSQQKDKSDDVRIGGARRPNGSATWEKPFVMTDSFGLADNNPCLLIDRNERLWLIQPTLLGVPQWSWGSALVRFHISADYQKPGRPAWETQEILVPHVEGMEPVLEQTLAEMEKRGGPGAARVENLRTEIRRKFSEPLATRLGWMPRAHPLVRKDGAILVPLSNENFNVAVMAITADCGKTWTFSKPVPEAGITQPTVVEFPDGKLAAFFRNGDPRRRIKRSDSIDGGMTWSEVTVTDLPHLGSGIEALVLKNGHLLMIYNDKEKDPRDRLAVSISEDAGKTWRWTRRLEDTPNARFDYPSIIQSRDGTLHATYSDNLKTVKYVRFNEEWVQ